MDSKRSSASPEGQREMNQRHGLFDARLNPVVKLYRIDLQFPPDVFKERSSPEHQESSPSLVQVKLEEPPQIKEEHEESSPSLVLVKLEPPQIKEEQSEVLLRPEEAAGSSLTFQALKQDDVEDCGTSRPTSDELLLCDEQLLSSHGSESDTDDSDDWETRDDELNTLKSYKKHHVEGQTFSFSKLSQNQKSFKQKPSMSSQTGEKIFSCKKCGKVCGCKRDLRRHMMILHTDKMPFACKVCKQSFTKNEALKKHMRIHPGRPGGVQELIVKAVSDAKKSSGVSLVVIKKVLAASGYNVEKKRENTRVISALNSLVAKGTLLRTKGFGALGSFKLNRIHTGGKPFGCTVCDKSFKGNYQLETHMRIHPGPVQLRLEEPPHITEEHEECSISQVQVKLEPPQIKEEQSDVLLRPEEPSMRGQTGKKGSSCTACGKVCVSKSALKTHMKIHTCKKSFSCTVCNKSFTQKETLKHHMRIHTGEKPFSCTVCSKSFGYKQSLKSHMRIHTGEKPFACTLCDKSFRLNQGLIEHMRIHTGEKPFACTLCDKSFRLNQGLKEHMMFHTGEKPFACAFCNKTFKQNVSLKEHMRVHTGEKPFPCTVCDKSFRVNQGLKEHMTFHTGEKPFACTVCNKTFRHAKSLKSHMSIHTGEKPFACTVCNKTFRHVKSLKTHMSIHTGEKPFACTVCNKTFRHAKSLKTHMSIHTGEKPFACTVCNKTFRHAKSLKTHMSIHTGEKPFTCTVCNKAFNQTFDFKVHMRLHTGEKPFACTVCEKSFRHKQALKMHMMSHTGEMPFGCTVCNKTFRHTKSLKRHMMFHTREKKPFACTVSNKSITQNVSLKEHMRIHTDETPFVCQICNKSFRLNQALKKHMQTYHSVQKIIINAVSASKERSGVSLTALKKALAASGYDVEKKNTLVKIAVKNLVANGTLLQTKGTGAAGSFKLNKIHTVKKPFACTVCNKSFKRNLELQKHRMVHEKKPFACTVCNKRFALNHSLKLHIRIHSDSISDLAQEAQELIVKAVSDSKKWSGVSLVVIKRVLAAGGYDVEKNNSHVKIALKNLVANGTLLQTKGTGFGGSFKLNTVKRPFACTVCNKSFVWESQRKVHMRVHPGLVQVEEPPQIKEEHEESSISLVQVKPEPPQIKEEQSEVLLRPEEAAGTSLTLLAVKHEDDDGIIKIII